jgi:hypothetical protein
MALGKPPAPEVLMPAFAASPVSLRQPTTLAIPLGLN